MKLLKGLKLILNIARFGITSLIKWLVASKRLKDQYHFDIDKDGEVDATITFHGDEKSESDQEEDKS